LAPGACKLAAVFSTRLPWQRPENALARAERVRRASGLPICDLTESNPTRVGLRYPDAELRDALAAVAADAYQPDPLGLRAARAALAADYAAGGNAVDADRLVLTASSSESYAVLFKLLCDPGDAILVPEPSYPLFEYLAALEGVRPIGYRLSHEGDGDGEWHIDFDSLAEARARATAAGGSGARAIVVVNPNNPTGSFARAAELVRLGDVASEAGLAVISDEVFAPYRFADGAGQRDETTAPTCLAAAPTLADRVPTFSLGGLSKACGLPQLKLGWILAGGPAPLVTAALARLELITDTYLSVGGPVQRALPRLLALGAVIRAGIQDRVRGNRAALRAAIPADSPCSLLAAQGGWTAILRVPDVLRDAGAASHESSDARWASQLITHDGVLIHPGYLYDMPSGAYLIASLLPAPDTFSVGAAAVIARCSQSVP
jgi:alanine-synthesizing transaminase